MRVHFTNLGCKLNQAELEDAARRFVGAGHSIARSLAEADLHVVNSCTVTHLAARDSRKVARRGRRLNPAVKTVLTGCYVAAEPEEAARLAGVDLIVANSDKQHLLERVHEAFPDQGVIGAAPGPLAIPYVPMEFGNSRALLKIEDGCNMRCSFCIIPATRGSQRSRPADDVVAEVAAMAAGGFQEVVLTGVQISSYRAGDTRLVDLVERVLRETDVPRLRLTSIAPWQFDQRLLGLLASDRLCRHFHLSLQSGCDDTLTRMRRPYSTAQFRELVADIRAAAPGTALTTDVIVGFPGETDAEFERSLAFVREMEFAGIHAFPYSVRPGTEAAEMRDQIPYEVRRERMRPLLELAATTREGFWRSQVGLEVQVLWEEPRDGAWIGTTDNYIRTLRSGSPRHSLQTVRLERIVDGGVLAEEVAA
jgi:threonylcarbamoyladenosine tRNA methylthiotransferase MtaB